MQAKDNQCQVDPSRPMPSLHTGKDMKRTPCMSNMGDVMSLHRTRPFREGAKVGARKTKLVCSKFYEWMSILASDAPRWLGCRRGENAGIEARHIATKETEFGRVAGVVGVWMHAGAETPSASISMRASFDRAIDTRLGRWLSVCAGETKRKLNHHHLTVAPVAAVKSVLNKMSQSGSDDH